jgi:POT family proton-dependent oligopeptide transporter|tara:strand:+ start:1729 stop:3051 length:1323 start_codon:yes stop_codon:yes gene_type:complete
MNYLTKPRKTNSMPKGIPYIIGNELAERFSFYGMKCILIIFMTQYLINDNNALDPMSDTEATKWYHLFTSAVYFTPIFGALLSDVFIGKFKTILLLSIIYCFGHLSLAIDETRFGLIIGLSLISIGAGGIKPCVSAHVGDQFGKTNSILLTKVFSWFYLSINMGAFISTLLTPYLLHNYGPWLAFGIPGLLMFIATYIFWLGRHVFIHIPPKGLAFFKKIVSKESMYSISKLSIIYIFIAIFWSLFDQTGSTWVLQAENLNRNWLGINWYSSQIQSINPIMILIFAPLFSYYLYPKLNKITNLTDLKKISMGLFLAVPSFIIIGFVEKWIELGYTPSIGWQVFAYIILTASEVLVSITCLEFSYTQAPNFMKSLIMGFFLLSVSIGNIFTVWINSFMIANNITYSQSYFNFYAFLMLVTALLFLLVVKFYRPNYYIHSEA